MGDELEPFVIGIGDEERRRRDEQQRRDDEARRAALEALQRVEPQLSEMDRQSAQMTPEPFGMSQAERDARAPTQPGSTFASVPGARRTGATGSVVPGVAAPPPDRAAPPPQAAPAPPQAAAAPPSVAAQPEARLRAQMPRFEQPRGNPMTAAAGAVRDVEQRREDEGAEQAAIDRWDQRIRAVEQMYSQERDQRRRAMLGSLLANIVAAAGRFMAGSRTAMRPATPRFDAFRDRTNERLAQQAGEWDATDRAVLRAAELREGDRARAMQTQDRASQRALQERGLGLQERRLDMQAAGDEERRGLARQELERVAAERAQRGDARSPLSQSYQDTMRQRIETYRATGQAPLADSLERLFGDRLESMTAEQLEPLLGRTGGLPQVHTRGRAGGTGGTAAADARRAGVVAVGETDTQRFVDAGLITSEAAQGLTEQLQSSDRRTREAAQAEINRLNGRMPASGASRVLIPGVRAGDHVDDTQARQYTSTLVNTRGALEALQVYDDVYRRYGASGFFSAQARAEMEAAHDRLVAMVASIRGTGVISPTEMPTIDAALPNPTSFTQATLGTFPARLRAYRESLLRNAVAALDAAGVDDAGRQAAERYLGGSQPARAPEAQPQSGGRMFRVTAPDGRTLPQPVDEATAERFRQRGGFRIEEAR